ncbi:dihydrofolate reductase [Nocardioides ginsengisegetis]|uniref:Dihydrofolate reductase n=1 Tax=Nocardioides ginsengisegetis TaxID=661491 RepID=A0A7W3IX09_9ACTN|nr:dihydrofolate reductase family protein [Nocardioides ginsengisegetis]MBA8802210.1 dihydrofolate reductase [Nocardioides ginsengisegetis]
MARVVYFTACTLDGFIADADNGLDWLFEVPHAEDDGDWDAFISRIGALVMGATTWEWLLAHEDVLGVRGPSAWRTYYDDRPGWVFSHRDLPMAPGLTTLVSGDVRPVYDEICARLPADGPGSDIWVVGGGDLVGQFDDAGLLDELHLGLTPVTLGAGAPLLPRRITSARMSFRSVHQAGQRVRLVLDVVRGS